MSQNRIWDFEGRCVECRKNLLLKVKVLTQHQLCLTIEPCEEHPDNSYILWPQRDDIKRED